MPCSPRYRPPRFSFKGNSGSSSARCEAPSHSRLAWCRGRCSHGRGLTSPPTAKMSVVLCLQRSCSESSGVSWRIHASEGVYFFSRLRRFMCSTLAWLKQLHSKRLLFKRPQWILVCAFWWIYSSSSRRVCSLLKSYSLWLLVAYSYRRTTQEEFSLIATVSDGGVPSVPTRATGAMSLHISLLNDSGPRWGGHEYASSIATQAGSSTRTKPADTTISFTRSRGEQRGRWLE